MTKRDIKAWLRKIIAAEERHGGQSVCETFHRERGVKTCVRCGHQEDMHAMLDALGTIEKMETEQKALRAAITAWAEADKAWKAIDTYSEDDEDEPATDGELRQLFQTKEAAAASLRALVATRGEEAQG